MLFEQERRRFRRYPLRLRARLHRGLEEADAEILNASMRGCLMRTHLTLKAGDIIEASVPDLRVPPTSMVVVRSAPTDLGYMVTTRFDLAVTDESSLIQYSSELSSPSPIPLRFN